VSEEIDLSAGKFAVEVATLVLGSLLVTPVVIPEISPQALVRKVVANELKMMDPLGHYMYRVYRATPHGSQTKEVIETKQWLIGRVVEINGKPLTPGQRRKEDQRLEGLLENRSELAREQKKQREDERLVRMLIRSLPDAFFYEYAGEQQGPRRDSLVQLRFYPDPNFRPPSLKLRVLEGMKGTMLVNTSANRIVRLDAGLYRNIGFGWGLLAHLNQGGSFQLEQRSLDRNQWYISEVVIHFTGSVVLFKKIDINKAIRVSDFHRMPDDLTLKQGVELLKKQAEVVAGKPAHD
jgi:hypothetical protein